MTIQTLRNLERGNDHDLCRLSLKSRNQGVGVNIIRIRVMTAAFTCSKPRKARLYLDRQGMRASVKALTPPETIPYRRMFKRRRRRELERKRMSTRKAIYVGGVFF
jgi:hypothetical protein